MESLEAIDPEADIADAPPLLAGLQPVAGHDSLWATAGPRRSTSACWRRGRVASLTRVSRPDRRPDRRWRAGIGVDRARQGARSERLPAGPARGATAKRPKSRIENLMELVSAAREYETARSRAVARRLRRSAVAALGRRRGGRHPRRARADDDDAQRQGARVPGRRHRRPRRGPVSALPVRATTKRSSKRSGGCATSASRGPAAAGADQRGAPARVWRLSVHRAVAVPRRDPAGADRTRSSRPTPRVPGVARRTATTSSGPTRTGAGKGMRRGRVRDARGSRSTRTRTRISRRRGPSARHARPPRPVRRRHVIAVEEHNDDLKLTVRFNTVGVKKLLAKFAKLELA